MKSVALTDVGKQRDINQDYVYRSDESLGQLPSLYIVADGMGGHRAGDFASRFCVLEFIDEIKESRHKTILSTMDAALTSANYKLYEKASNTPELQGTGTTFVAAVVGKNSTYILNVGDSRLYWFDKYGRFRQVTKDHSRVEELIDLGRLDRKAAPFHPEKNIITRAVGIEDTVSPDYFEIDTERGDILLLCSDGLSNFLEEEGMAVILAQKNKSLDEKAQEMIDIANDRGGKDNISVVLVEI